MRKPEQNLYDSLLRNCPANIWLERVENVATDGMPDVHGITSTGREVWIELKAPIRPKRTETKLFRNDSIRPSQIGWHLNYAAHKGKSWFLIRDSSGELFFIPGAFVMDIRNKTVKELRALSVANTWDGIFLKLFDPLALS